MNTTAKNIGIGILLGAAAYHIYLKYKKPCGCKHATPEETASASTPTSNASNASACEEAVKEVINERRKVMKMSEDGFKKMYADELKICMEMNS
jgi:hypothetical protein